MSFLSDLREYSARHVDEHDTEPRSVSISVRRDGSIQLSPDWLEEKDFGPGDSEPVEWPTSYYLDISDTELGTRARKRIDENLDKIAAPEVDSIRAMSLSELTPPANGDDDFEWPFYTAEDATMRFMVLVEKSYPLSEVSHLTDLVIEDLSGIDPDAGFEDVTEMQALFDDMAVCNLGTIRGEIMTQYPHRYYKGVESVEDYISAIADDEEEKEELRSQGTYEVFFRLGDAENDPGEAISRPYEEFLTEQKNSLVSVEGEHQWEGESISYEGGDDFVTLSFWIRIPYEP